MIDIHNHVIYKFDDGPKSLKESLKMLQIAEGQGISDVFATSHFKEIIRPEEESDYFEKLKILQQEAADNNISVNIHSGGELFYSLFMNKVVKQHKVATLAGLGQYILMEFSLFIMPSGVEDVLFKLTMDGFIPIIAHPERYPSIRKNPYKALDYLRFGAIYQMNAGSILGSFGKDIQKVSMWMLENKLVHFISSDAHTIKNRTFRMQEAAAALKPHLDENYIADLVENNARKILNSEKIEKVKIPDLSREGILQKLKKKFFTFEKKPRTDPKI
jgi:protein-tyrosine phosphatase